MSKIVKGSVALSVFELPEQIATLSANQIVEKLCGHAFIPIDPDSVLDSSEGWVDWQRTSQPISESSECSIGSYFMLALRCDQYKYDAATVEMMAEAYCIEQGFTQAYKEMKGKLRQPVVDAIKAQLRAKTIPKSHVIEAAIDHSFRRIYVFSKASADIAAVSSALMLTFGVEAQYLNYAYLYLKINEEKTVPAKMLMMSLYKHGENKESFEIGGREVYCLNGDSLKLHGVAEGNLGNEYQMKMANEREDIIASNLINNDAAWPVEMGFKVDSQWGDISFKVHADKLVPYGIELPLPTERDESNKIAERINMVAWLNQEWLDILAAAVQFLKDKEWGEEGEPKPKDGIESITISTNIPGVAPVTMKAGDFDKAVEKITGKGKKPATKIIKGSKS